MNKDFNVYKWRRDNLTEVNGSDEYGLNENITPINDLEGVKNFLYDNKEKIFQIADKHKGDTMAMQAELNSFLAPYIKDTPEFMVTRLKAAIGSGILRRNVASNPESATKLDKLK